MSEVSAEKVEDPDRATEAEGCDSDSDSGSEGDFDAGYPECEECGQPLPIDTSSWPHNIPDSASKLQRPAIRADQRYQVWVELTRGLTKEECYSEAKKGEIRVRRPFSMTLFAGAFADEKSANELVDDLVKNPAFENFYVYAFDALYPVAFPLIESMATDTKVHSSVVDTALRRNRDAAFREREALIDSVIAAGGQKGTLKYETRAGKTRSEPIPERRKKGRRLPKRKGGRPPVKSSVQPAIEAPVETMEKAESTN